MTWLAAGQGLGMLGADLPADRFDPMVVNAGSGLIACLLALLVPLTGSPEPSTANGQEVRAVCQSGMPVRTSGAPSRAASAVWSSGCSCDSRSALTRSR